MVFKLDFMQEKSSTKVSSTDWAQLGGNVSQSNRLQLPDLPSVLVRPKDGQNGLIEFHGKKLILYSDNTFFYGAWPQKKVLPVYQEKLNQALLQNKIRHNGHYYTLNGLAQQEYTVGDKCYVLVENHTCWMEVLPVKWVLDEKKQKAYSDQILVADTQKSSHFYRDYLNK